MDSRIVQCDKDYMSLSQLVLRDHGKRVHLLIRHIMFAAFVVKSFFGSSKLKRHKRRVRKKCQVQETLHQMSQKICDQVKK